MFGRRDRVVDFVRLHGREVEEQNYEAAIFELRRLIARRSGRTRRCRRRLGQRLCLRDIRCGQGIDVLYVKGNNFLRLVVFENCEICRFQASHKLSALILYADIHQHEIRLRMKHIVRLLLRRQSGTQEH